MVQVGRYNTLKVVKHVDFGVYLDGGDTEILLPKRYVPEGLEDGDEITVFVYHDSENRLIATTDKPLGLVGDIAIMEVVSTTEHGAFLRWGIMKDVFVPISQQVSRMYVGESYPVYLYIDERTGRVTGTEKIWPYLSNEQLTVNERDTVTLLIYRRTDLGYGVVINNKHIGLLHFNEVFRDLELGERLEGFVKKIRPDNKIDVVLGKPGYNKVAPEEEKILSMLQNNNGYLPFHDKSDPGEIYAHFGMSKKTFKMAIGALYKQRKISMTQTGIKLED